MDELRKEEERSSWLIGGATIIGIGIGLIILKTLPLIFAASILIAIGAAALLAPLFVSRN